MSSVRTFLLRFSTLARNLAISAGQPDAYPRRRKSGCKLIAKSGCMEQAADWLSKVQETRQIISHSAVNTCAKFGVMEQGCRVVIQDARGRPES